MRHPMRHAAAIALGLLGLTGCHSFQSLTGYSSGPAAPPTTSFIPSPGNEPNAITGQIIDGPKIKNMRGTNTEKVAAFLAAAQAMESSGKWAEACAYYEQVRQLDPSKGLLCARHLAILYDRKGDFDKARDEYGLLLRANPKDAAAYNDFGYGYYSRGQFEMAEKNLRTAVELDPKNSLAWSNLGMTLAQLSRYDESLSAFQKSTQKSGAPVTRAQALCNIGFIQAAQGKWVEARDSYAAAIQLEPSLQKARAALERMEQGPRANKDRDRLESKKRFRELERAPMIDPEVARSLPFGAPAGAIGADSGSNYISYISNEDAPINLPMPGGYAPPPISARATPPAPPAQGLQLPPIPQQLVVD
jgi:tetratricopeptide (TPR) repeat protein